MRIVWRVAPLLTLEAGAIVALHRLGTVPGFSPVGDLPTWWRTAPLEDLAASTIRLVALAVAVWALGSTVACLAARGCARAPALARTLRAVALPGIRRLVDRTLAAGCLAGTAVLALPGPVGAAEPAPAPVVRAAGVDEAAGPPVVRAPQPPPVVRTTGRAPSPAPRADRSAAPDAAPTPPPPVAPAAGPSPGAVHRIRPGEHLWGVAEAAVHRVEPRAGVERVARYWAVVVRANRSTIASGDPDVVYPGEVLTLPPLSP